MAAVGDPPLQSRGPKERSASRLSEVGTILHRPGPLQTAKPPCGLVARGEPARCRGLHDGVGRRPIRDRRTREGDQSAPPEVFSFGAGWLAGARRRAGSRALREPTLANTDLCLRLLDVGLPMGCCTPAGFKFLPPLEYPPLAVSLFLEAAGNAFGCKCSAQKGPAATRLRHWCSAAGIYLV